MAAPLTQDLAGYFPPCKLGEINVPTIVVDKFNRMLMVALPGAFSDARIVSRCFLIFTHISFFQREYRDSTKVLGKELAKNIDSSDNWRAVPGLFQDPREGEVSGVADISFAWFAQGHEVRLVLHPSYRPD